MNSPKVIKPVFSLELQKEENHIVVPSNDSILKLFSIAWELVGEESRKLFEAEAAGKVEGQSEASALCNIYIVSDDQISKLNKMHMGHDGATDVLSFPLGNWDLAAAAFHFGEIITSYDTAMREADLRGLPGEQEVARYIVHGFLHLVGYEDHTTEKRTEMEAVQEEILRRI